MNCQTPDEPERQTIAYLTYDCTDSSVIRRAAMFQSAGFLIKGIMFRRARVNVDYRPEWDNLDLGTLKDRAFARRIIHLLQAVIIIWRSRAFLSEVSGIYARNLDLALLALFVRAVLPRRPPIIYEVLDVHRLLVGRGLPSRALRVVERIVLSHSSLLVVSSPAFVSEYFRALQRYCGPHQLLENKLVPAQVAKLRPALVQMPVGSRNGRPGPWVLGWFGALRCEVSLGILTELARRLPESFVLYLRGYPTDLEWKSFADEIRGVANVVYDGRYRYPDDLPEIYSRVHFNWCFDFADPVANSKWLLPNRIYEGGYFNCPALAARNTATGCKVDSLGLGASFEQPFLEELVDFFQTMTAERYQSIHDKLSALPRTEFCDNYQFDQLVERVRDIIEKS